MKNVCTILLFTLLATIAASAADPAITSVTRDTAFPTSTASVKVTFVAAVGTKPLDAASARLCYQVESGAPQCMTATALNDSTFTADIPPQAAEAFVRYWVTIADQSGLAVVAPNDTATFKYYYRVLNDLPPFIADIQSTPNLNGRSGFVGFTLLTGGIVVADTSHITGDYSGTGPTDPFVVVQDSRGPWSGITLRARGTNGEIIPGIAALRRGDVVRIRGVVNEHGDLTVLEDATVTELIGNGIPPEAIVRTTDEIGMKKDGETQDAEKYESMQMEYQQVIVVRDTADDAGSGQFFVADESTKDDPATWTRIETDNGHGGYTTRTPGPGQKKIINGMRFEHIRGIVIQSGGVYKLVPTDTSDYREIPGLGVNEALPVLAGAAMRVSPNPVSERTTIELELSAGTTLSVELVDVLGRRVETILDRSRLDAGTHPLTLDVSTLSAGEYFLHARARAGVLTQVVRVVR